MSNIENKSDVIAMPQRSSTAWVVFSWLWAGIPLAWGVSQTVIKAMGLFS